MQREELPDSRRVSAAHDGRFLLGAVQLERHADELKIRQQAIEGMIAYLVDQGWDRAQLAKLRTTRDQVLAATEAVRDAAKDLRGNG